MAEAVQVQWKFELVHLMSVVTGDTGNGAIQVLARILSLELVGGNGDAADGEDGSMAVDIEWQGHVAQDVAAVGY